MTVPAVIPFALGAVVILWAIWGTWYAFSGGKQSGLPLIVGVTEVKDVEADQPASNQRWWSSRRAKVGLPALAVIVVLAIIGAIVIS